MFGQLTKPGLQVATPHRTHNKPFALLNRPRVPGYFVCGILRVTFPEQIDYSLLFILWYFPGRVVLGELPDLRLQFSRACRC